MQDGFTSFSMDEEYEGAEIDNKGFVSFKKEKQKSRFTKEEQTYGVFYEGQKEEQKVEDSLNYSAELQNKKNYLMGFRKSGKVQHDPRKVISVTYFKKDEEKKAEEEEEERKKKQAEEEELERTRKRSFDEDFQDEDEEDEQEKNQQRVKKTQKII